MDLLTTFYHESSARKFWLTELWPQTREVREEKVILPQLEWAQGFISQYFSRRKLLMVEFLPSNWCYYQSARNVWPEAEYQLIDLLFDSKIAIGEVSYTSESRGGLQMIIYDSLSVALTKVYVSDIGIGKTYLLV